MKEIKNAESKTDDNSTIYLTKVYQKKINMTEKRKIFI